MVGSFTCGRRHENGMADPDSPFHAAGENKDHWTDRDGYNACSYCGSLDPEQLFLAIYAGAELGPTDKNYKVYIDLPAKKPEEMVVRVSQNFEPENKDGWVKLDDKNWVKPEKYGHVTHAKFYFQHLNPEQQKHFIDILNAKKVKIGMPGYFYSLPFFIRKKE